jgi:hypothetical protein
VRQSKLHPSHVQPAQGLQQATIISVYIFLDECYARQCTVLNYCAVVMREGKSLRRGSSDLRRSN